MWRCHLRPMPCGACPSAVLLHVRSMPPIMACWASMCAAAWGCLLLQAVLCIITTPTSGCAYFMMCSTDPPEMNGMTIHSSWPLTNEQ